MTDRSLTPTEEQIVRWLREGRLDAEIAVRLGISVGEAKEKIARLQSRFGADDRADLAGKAAISGGSSDQHDWSRPKPGEERRAEPVEGESAGDETVDLAESGGYSLRAVMLAAIGGVVLAGAVIAGFAMVLSGGDEDPGAASGDATETATPRAWTALPTEPPATATAHPGVDAIEPVPGETWTEQGYEANTAIPQQHGIFFMSPSDGRVVGYQVDDGGVDRWYQYMAGATNRLLFAQDQEETHLYDRTTRQAWSWPRGELAVWDASWKYVLVQETEPSPGARQDARSTPRFHLLVVEETGALEVVNSFALPHEGSFQVPWQMELAEMNQAGTHAALVLRDPFEAGTSVYMVDLRAGEARLLDKRDADWWLTGPEWAVGGNGVALTWSSSNLESREPTHAAVYRWSGELVASLDASTGQPHWTASVQFSPDGEYAFVESAMQVEGFDPELITAFGAGSWPQVTLYRKRDVTEWEPVWRVKSATINYGDQLSGSRWLADSSGFVANIFKQPTSEQPWDDQRAAIFSVERPALELFASLPESDDWWQSSHSLLPNPLAPQHFSNHRTALYNAELDRWWFSSVGDGPTHLNPWNEGYEMVFATPHGGHGGSPGPVLVAPKFEEPPFDEEDVVRLEVKGEGECLRVRSKPGTTGDILGCAADGSLVTVRQPVWEDPNITDSWPPDQPGPGANVHYNSEDEIRFTYVAAGEVEGWVAMEFLGWPE